MTEETKGRGLDQATPHGGVTLRRTARKAPRTAERGSWAARLGSTRHVGTRPQAARTPGRVGGHAGAPDPPRHGGLTLGGARHGEHGGPEGGQVSTARPQMHTRGTRECGGAGPRRAVEDGPAAGEGQGLGSPGETKSRSRELARASAPGPRRGGASPPTCHVHVKTEKTQPAPPSAPPVTSS